MNIGRLGEEAAYKYLVKNGYQIIGRNITFRWAEIDIIAQKDNTIFFIEVKSRQSERAGKPYEAITKHKLNHLSRSISLYIKLNKIHHSKLSFDIITVNFDRNLNITKIEHYQNFPLEIKYV